MATPKKIRKFMPKTGSLVFMDGSYMNTGKGVTSVCTTGECKQPLIVGTRGHSIPGGSTSFGSGRRGGSPQNEPIFIERENLGPYKISSEEVEEQEVVDGMMILIRKADNSKYYAWISMDTDPALTMEERMEGSSIVFLSGYDANGLPTEYKDALIDLEQGNVQLPKLHKFITKAVSLPGSWYPDIPVGTEDRIGFLITAPFYHETTFTVDGYARRFRSESRPMTWFLQEPVPGSGDYQQYEPWPNTPTGSIQSLMPVMVGSAQDPTVSMARPYAVAIGDDASLDVIDAELHTHNVFTAEDVYYGYTTEDHTQVYWDLRYRSYNPVGTVTNDTLIGVTAFKDKYYDAGLSLWTHVIEDYPYYTGYMDDSPPIEDRFDLAITPISVVPYSDNSGFDIYLKRTSPNTVNNPYDFYSYIDKVNFSCSTAEFNGAITKVATLTDANNHEQFALEGQVDGVLSDQTTITKDYTILETINEVIPYGGSNKYYDYQNMEVSCGIIINGVEEYTITNSMWGWWTGDFLASSPGNGVLHPVPYDHILDLHVYAQDIQSDHQVVIYSVDQIIWQHNLRINNQTQRTVQIYDWPNYPDTEDWVVNYDHTCVTKQKNEIKFFIGIDGVALPMTLPTSVWGELNGDLDENGTPILGGIKQDMLVAHNNARADYDLECLEDLYPDPFLERLAQYKADDMAATSHFDHDGVNGDTPYDRTVLLGRPLVTIGENLFFMDKPAGVELNADDVQYMVTEWLSSPGHRATLLNPNNIRVGFGFAYESLGSTWRYYCAAEFMYCHDDPTAIPGIVLDVDTGDWSIDGNFDGCTHENDLCSMDMPPLGVVYNREERAIIEYTSTGTWEWVDTYIYSTHTNDADPKDENGDSLDPATIPGYEMRDVSISRYGRLVIVSFMLEEVWRDGPEWLSISEYRNITGFWNSTNELSRRIFQFYDLEEQKCIWNGTITSGTDRLTVGLLDLVGDLTEETA